MHNRTDNQPKHWLSNLGCTTATVLKGLIWPGVNAYTSYSAYREIQALRMLDASPLKDALKTMTSSVSSTVNAADCAYSAYTFIETMIKTGAWNYLSTTQRLALTTLVAASLAGMTYSMVNFGVEHTTLTSGLAAAASALSLNVADNMTTFFVNRNASKNNGVVDEESGLLPTPA
jgi:hypothetical protein